MYKEKMFTWHLGCGSEYYTGRMVEPGLTKGVRGRKWYE